MYLIIHICLYICLLMLSNSLKIIKIDRNMWQLRQIVCRNTILKRVHFLFNFLNYQLSIETLLILTTFIPNVGPGSLVSIATTYVVDGPGIESRWR